MEIDIKIKLEDADIALLIKSLFEILKKIPQDNINITIDPNATPTSPPPVQVVPLTTPPIRIEPPYKHKDGTAVDPLPHTPSTTTADEHIKITDTTTTDKVFYSNGSSVKIIEEEKKTKEE